MDRKNLFACLQVALWVLMAGPASAAVSPYVGVGFGLNTFDTNLGPGSGVSLDDSDSGARFTLGLALNDVAALEVSRIDFGEGALRGTAGGIFTLGNDAYVFTADGEVREELATWSYGLVVSLPLNRLNGNGGPELFVPYLRAGFHSWDLDQSATASGYTVTASDSGTNPWFGLGVEVRMGEHAGVRLGYDWFTVKDDDNVIDKVTSLGMDLLLRF
jgi:opacity protein-like surface antigen